MSFLMEVEFEHFTEVVDESGNKFEGPEEIGFEAWLMWEDILTENAFNIKVGSLGMNELWLPNTRDHNRIHKNHYLYRDKITMGGMDSGKTCATITRRRLVQ